MKVTNLFLRENKEATKVEKLSLTLPENLDKANRQICFLATENFFTKEQMEGFCAKKFKGDIETTGVDYTKIKKGDLVKIGTATLEITIVGKKCWEDCPLNINNNPCKLPLHTAFAKVIKEGYINKEDNIII